MANGISFGPQYNQKRIPIAAPFRWLSGALRPDVNIDPVTGQASVDGRIRDRLFNLGRGQARATEFNADMAQQRMLNEQRMRELQQAQQADYALNEMIQKYGLKQAVKPERIRGRAAIGLQETRNAGDLAMHDAQTRDMLQRFYESQGIPVGSVPPNAQDVLLRNLVQSGAVRNRIGASEAGRNISQAGLMDAQAGVVGQQAPVAGTNYMYDPNNGMGFTIDMRGQPQTFVTPNMDAFNKRYQEAQSDTSAGGAGQMGGQAVAGQMAEGERKGATARKAIGGVGSILSAWGDEEPTEEELEAVRAAGQLLQASPYNIKNVYRR